MKWIVSKVSMAIWRSKCFRIKKIYSTYKEECL